MKKIIILSLVVLLLVFSACSKDVDEQPEFNPDNLPDDPLPPGDLVENEADPDVSFAIEKGDLSDSFSIESAKFIPFAPNAYGDASALRRLEGSTSFEANLRLFYDYTPSEKLEGKDVYMKILGLSSGGDVDALVYAGPLLPDMHSVEFTTRLAHAGQDPKLEFCFGSSSSFDPVDAETDDDVACFSRLINSPKNDIFPLVDSLSFSFNTFQLDEGTRLEDTQSLTVRNTGTVPLTVFVSLPDLSQEIYSFEPNSQAFFIDEGEEYDFSLTAEWIFEGNDLDEKGSFFLFALPDNCNEGRECVDSAKIVKEIDYRLSD